MLALLVTLLLTIGAVALWLAVTRDRFTVSIGDPGGRALLAAVVGKAGPSLRADGPVEAIDADGTTPDTARQSFATPRSAFPALAASVGRACSSIGLHAPGRDATATDPTTRCAGAWHGRDAFILVASQCAHGCAATITAEVY